MFAATSPIEWVLDHFQLLIVAAAVVASWIAQTKKKAEQRRLGRNPSSMPTRPVAGRGGPGEVSVDEQVRRVQEEIRRKIQERAQGHSMQRPAQPAAMRPAAQSPEPKARTVTPPPIPSHTPAPQTTVSQAVANEALLEEMRRLEERRRAAKKQEGLQRERAAEQQEEAARTVWASEMRDAHSLRRAIVLNEVLGPPVSMRR